MIFNFQAVIEKFLKITLILFFAFLINRVFQVLLKKGIERKIEDKLNGEKKKRVQTLISVFGGTIRFIIWIVAILIILPEFGVSILPILTSLGLAGLAIGMAAKDLIADFISGIFIVLEDQYRVGDKIKVLGLEGEVIELTLRKTVIKDGNGFIHSIPNSQIKIVSKKE